MLIIQARLQVKVLLNIYLYTVLRNIYPLQKYVFLGSLFYENFQYICAIVNRYIVMDTLKSLHD